MTDIFEDVVLLEMKMILNSITQESYIVGGAVRDMLYNIVPKDYDFVVQGVDYDELSDAFRLAGWTTKETGKAFLVLMVTKVLPNIGRVEYEIALMRKDGTYSDGRRPNSVECGDIQSDAQRRDFSINSLYFCLSTNTIIDPTNKGIKDLRNRTLRFNGKAKERIEEDYLRLYRAIRFLKVYNLTWARGTERIFNRMFILYSNKVNPQRVLNELNKIGKR